jgi:hypothetical protein
VEEAGCTVESPEQPVENTLGVATGRFPIGRRSATCPTILHWAFIPFGGQRAYEDSQEWLPHQACQLHVLANKASAAGECVVNIDVYTFAWLQ